MLKTEQVFTNPNEKSNKEVEIDRTGNKNSTIQDLNLNVSLTHGNHKARNELFIYLFLY